MIALLFSTILLQDNMIDLVKNNKIASLSTNYQGIPFGSTMPFILDEKGRPVIFISSMALHTKNIKTDPKCSMMMYKVDKENVFNTARITFIGKMVKIDSTDELKKAYLEKYKKADDFIDFEDFSFYRLEIEKIYYIGGLGDIQWIDVADYYHYHMFKE